MICTLFTKQKTFHMYFRPLDLRHFFTISQFNLVSGSRFVLISLSYLNKLVLCIYFVFKITSMIVISLFERSLLRTYVYFIIISTTITVVRSTTMINKKVYVRSVVLGSLCLHLGILSAFLLLTWYTLLVDYFQVVRKFLVFSFFSRHLFFLISVFVKNFICKFYNHDYFHTIRIIESYKNR